MFYDSLLAKIAVYGEDRQHAVRRLRDTLDAYVVSGVPTNLQMLRVIAQDTDFESGAIDTEYVGRSIEPALTPAGELPVQALASAIAHRLVSSGLAGYESTQDNRVAGDVWSRAGAWRMGRQDMLYAFTHSGGNVTANVSNKPGALAWNVHTLDTAFDLTLSLTSDGRTIATVDEETWTVEVAATDDGLLVHYDNADYLLGYVRPGLYRVVAGGQAARPAERRPRSPPTYRGWSRRCGSRRATRCRRGRHLVVLGSHEDGAPHHRPLRRRRGPGVL